MSITKINMIIFMEPDIDAAVAFYTQLGLKLTFRMKGKWAELDCQGVKIGLCPTGELPVERRTGVIFEVSDVVKLYEEFKSDIPFLDEPVEKVHGIMVSVKDPGGNIIELYQPTPQKVQEMVEKIKKDAPKDGCCGSEKKCCGPEN